MVNTFFRQFNLSTMQTTSITTTSAASTSKARLWTGRVITYLLIFFLLFDAFGKIVKQADTVSASAKMGWPVESLQPLGITLLIITILFAIPRTAVLGGVLLTAWLGGATAEMVRSKPEFLWFPIVFGILVWLALWLRDEKLSSHLPLRKS
jgi:hypothetical protein